MHSPCAICTIMCTFHHCVLHTIHRSYELTRLNVQILNIRQYSVLIIKYIILYWLDFLSSPICVCLNETLLSLNLLYQIPTLFLMFVEEIGVSQDKGSHRKSRPPLGARAKKLIWVGGQKLWLAKKLGEWICGKQEELLSRGYSSQAALQNCLEI